MVGVQIKRLVFQQIAQLIAVIKIEFKMLLYLYLEFANKMRNRLTICGCHLQFADSAYSCRFYRSSFLQYLCVIFCLCIPKNFLHSARLANIDFLNFHLVYQIHLSLGAVL